ncbi:hypothetical protein KI387_002129, partial [Taxus chinensis]
MSASKPFITRSWLDEGKHLSGRDIHKSESKPSMNTSRTFRSDGGNESGRYSGKETQKSDYGRSWSAAPMQSKLVSRRVCNKLFRTADQLKWRGESYNMSIDCDTSEWKMVIKVENIVAVNVDNLVWNFRGIKKFGVDSGNGPVDFEVVWNVEDWLFDKPMKGKAIFMFRNANPSSPPQATIADFISSSDITGDPLVIYAWKEEDRI